MSGQWLDDLSEDWVSQPGTSSPSNSAAGKQSKQSTRSRIPQFCSSSGAYPSIKQPRTHDSTTSRSRKQGVLTERSASRDNVQSPPTANAQGKAHTQRSGLTQRSISECSQTSVVRHGGTERKPTSASPPKDRKQYETPEWKRRLVQGKVDFGDQVDLFSPMGLEKMFQRPSGGTANKSKKTSRKQSVLKSLEEMPSSPPIWPGKRAAEDSEAFIDGTGLDVVRESDAEDSLSMRSGPSSEATRRPSQVHQGDSGRNVSAQSEASSDFSPVFISKHNDSNGRIEYAALDVPKSQLEELKKLQSSTQTESHNKPQLHISIPTGDNSAVSDSLPGDLPAGTPDAVSVGEFVSVKRGGYSADGSFRRRPLSPSPLARAPVRLDSESLTADSTQFQSYIDSSRVTSDDRVRPPAPMPPITATPTRPRQGDYLSPTRHQSSLSPLKLFGAHDTFTTNRLQRRMSQMELNDEGGENQLRPETVLSTQREASEEPPHAVDHESRTISSSNNFGAGELDEYPFPTEISVLSPPSSERQEQSEEGLVRSRSPSPSTAPPGAKDPLKFRVGSNSSEVHDTFKSKRKHSKVSTRSSLSIAKRSGNNTQRSLKPTHLNIITDFDQSAEPSFVSEGKRGPTTPFKNPTPKRRRTLVFADVEKQGKITATESIRESHDRMQSVIGRKRKDARHSNFSNLADADTIARRHILRPRNPTPSQRRREEIEQEVLEATEAYLNSSPRLEAIREHLLPPTIIEPGSDRDIVEQEQARAVAEEVAAFSVKIQKGMKDQGRKKSVTTQDFLDEAMKIMDFIRTKGRPTSGLGSLEESEESTEQELNEDMEGLEDVSELRLSRPPSREGREPILRKRGVEDLDPRVVSHLRQFEDKEDEDFVASSFQSLHIDHMSNRAPSPRRHLESDPPDIRVFDNTQARKKHAEADGPNSKSSSMPSHKSHPSGDSSLGRTTMTTASRKSDNVATLAPQAVAHLIPEDIGGMHFDKDKGMWVRMKNTQKSPEKPERDVSGITQSDEDPFGEIPDLTVDEAQELDRVMNSPSRRTTGMTTQMTGENAISEETLKPHENAANLQQLDASSAASQSAPLTSNVQHEETKSTSWSRHVVTESKEDIHTSEETVEHEIKIHEGRFKPQLQSQPRKVNRVDVSLSSPFVRRISQAIQTDKQQYNDEETQAKHEPQPQHQRTAQALAKQALQVVDEKHEVSIIDYAHDNRRVNFSLSIVQPPAKPPQSALVAPPSSPGPQADVTFYLSELSDFTLHQADERDTQDRIITRRAPNGLARVKEDRFEHGNVALVKALQDVEPDEPYWEDLRRVVLNGRNLTSLHLLDVLCDRIEVVDVSDNAITQLIGAPLSMRCLSIRNNLLTTLTAWDHLTNLQYLDVSGNDMDSLDGVACLVHLRDLKADNNRIESLEGIMGLDGLLSLSVRGNRVEVVDFGDSSLFRLERLDLAENQLDESQGPSNLQYLPALKYLNLDSNSLSSFTVSSEGEPSACPNLKVMSLRNNRLESISLPPSQLPCLREIWLDNNRLSSLAGLEKQQDLDIISVRNQHPPLASTLDGIFSHMPDARSIMLSGNHTPSLSVTYGRFFLNTTHLELASCGLASLPEEFGIAIPNLKSLNVNFNNLKDVRPLLGIKRLERLYLAGNRISRLRKLAMVLDRLGTDMREADLRNNPVTVGFYDTAASTALEDHGIKPLPAPAPEMGMQVVPATSTASPSTALHFFDGLDSSSSEMTKYIVPKANIIAQATYATRLDEDTKLRRRVYEMLLANGMPKLAAVDGLPFERKKVLVRDSIWERLVELGVVRKSERQGKA